MPDELLFFPTPADFREWLARHGGERTELWVGFYKRGTGKPSLTWPESVDAALCFGWIDGVRKSIDAEAYKIRFTPRKPTSLWSSVNIRRVAELQASGLMGEEGLAAFAKRTAERSGVYAYEQRHQVALDAASEKLFRKNKRAWAFFAAQPNWYRKVALWWVMSAKREETRAKRLAELISSSGASKTIRPLTRPAKKQN